MVEVSGDGNASSPSVIIYLCLWFSLMLFLSTQTIGWEPMGMLLLFVFVPIHLGTLIWFIRRRKFFPVVGR